MITVGPTTSFTAADNAGVGTIAWVIVGTAVAALGLSQTSHYLFVTGYGFAIPSNAKIRGIVVGIERRVTGAGIGQIEDNEIRLLKAGAVTGDIKGGTVWPAAYAFADYGTPVGGDRWGTSWTPAEINAADFGCATSCFEIGDGAKTAEIRTTRITIYYDFGNNPLKTMTRFGR